MPSTEDIEDATLRVRRVPSHPRREQYEDIAKTSYVCIVCGNDVVENKPHFVGHLIRGGHLILHPEDEAAYQRGEARTDRGNLGAQPVGPNCVKRFGLKEWVTRYDPSAKE